MTLRLLILSMLFSISSYGQVINSLSADQTGIYYHSFDSLIEFLSSNNQIKKIHLQAEPAIIRDFPDAIHNIQIKKIDNREGKGSKKLKENEVLILMHNLNFIKDEFTITFIAGEKSHKQLAPFEHGGYKFSYYFLPESKTYELRRIRTGI